MEQGKAFVWDPVKEAIKVATDNGVELVIIPRLPLSNLESLLEKYGWVPRCLLSVPSFAKRGRDLTRSVFYINRQTCRYAVATLPFRRDGSVGMVVSRLKLYAYRPSSTK